MFAPGVLPLPCTGWGGGVTDSQLDLLSLSPLWSTATMSCHLVYLLQVVVVADSSLLGSGQKAIEGINFSFTL